MKHGTLYLIPAFLAETNDERTFPPVNLEVIAGLNSFIAENVRTARRFLRKVGYTRDFDQVTFYTLNKHTAMEEASGFIEPLLQGTDVGLLSEAGIPCIADPGAVIVEKAHAHGIRVAPLTGPSSIFLALMASGFNGQHFVFHGYLPIDRKDREQKIRELERNAAHLKQTQIFMETPFRNNQLLEAVLRVCHDDRLLCIASMLTHDQLEFIRTQPVGAWKKKPPDLHKKPTVFLLF